MDGRVGAAAKAASWRSQRRHMQPSGPCFLAAPKPSQPAPTHPMALVRRLLIAAISSSAQAASPASGQSPASMAPCSAATTAAGAPSSSICAAGVQRKQKKAGMR